MNGRLEQKAEASTQEGEGVCRLSAQEQLKLGGCWRGLIG